MKAGRYRCPLGTGLVALCRGPVRALPAAGPQQPDGMAASRRGRGAGVEPSAVTSLHGGTNGFSVSASLPHR